jgi:hypothetical protein
MVGRGNCTGRKQVHMMPELDQPFGRHRWDPVAEIETLITKDTAPITRGGEDPPAVSGPESPDATG